MKNKASMTMEVDFEDELAFSTIPKQITPKRRSGTEFVSPTPKSPHSRKPENNLSKKMAETISCSHMSKRKSRHQVKSDLDDSTDEALVKESAQQLVLDVSSKSTPYKLRYRGPRILNQESIVITDSEEESSLNSSVEVFEPEKSKIKMGNIKVMLKDCQTKSGPGMVIKNEASTPEKPNFILKQLTSNLSPKYVSPVCVKRLIHNSSERVTNPPKEKQEPPSPQVVKIEKVVNNYNESPKRNYQLIKLETTLSPKITQTDSSHADGRVSRYGRHQKQKDVTDFIPQDVAKFVTKSPPKKKKEFKSDYLINFEQKSPEIKTDSHKNDQKISNVRQSPTNSKEIDTKSPEINQKSTEIETTATETGLENNVFVLIEPVKAQNVQKKNEPQPNNESKNAEIKIEIKPMKYKQLVEEIENTWNLAVKAKTIQENRKRSRRILNKDLEELIEPIETPKCLVSPKKSIVLKQNGPEVQIVELTSPTKTPKDQKCLKTLENCLEDQNNEPTSTNEEKSLETSQNGLEDQINDPTSPTKSLKDPNIQEDQVLVPILLSKSPEVQKSHRRSIRLSEKVAELELNSQKNQIINSSKNIEERHEKETSQENDLGIEIMEVQTASSEINYLKQAILDDDEGNESTKLQKIISSYEEMDEKYKTDYNDNDLNDISSIKLDDSMEETQKSVKARKLSDADSGKGSSLDIDGSTNYKVGQILWGFFSSQHWPCMVYPDPETNTIVTQVHLRDKVMLKIHVVFFGGKGQRYWIFERNLLPFISLESLQEHVMIGKYPQKYRNFISNNVSKKKINQHWNSCVLEAEEFVTYPILNRLDILLNKLEHVRQIKDKRKDSIGSNKSLVTQKTSTDKRRRSLSPESPPYEELVPLKKIKIEPIDESMQRFFNSLHTNLDTYDDCLNYILPPKDRDDFIGKIENFGRKSQRIKIKAIRSIILKDEPIEASKEAPIMVKKKRQRLTAKEEFTFKLEKNYLLKGAAKGYACRKCQKSGSTVKCSGKCCSYYHADCVGKTDASVKELKCQECETDAPLTCFVCNKTEEAGQIMRCIAPNCGYCFHVECLRLFPQHKVLNQTLCCPFHTCHTCVSEDPRGKALDRLKNLVKCIKCPTAYHASENCIPAGTEIISQYSIICTKHTPRNEVHINVSWCFICSQGGNLICCETCPTSFHLECLKFTPPPGNYYCEECETGRLPLYNEVVWCKLGIYRWWPALTLPPPVIPDSLLNLPNVDDHEFVVKFFGSRDQSWIKRERIFLYQEGDSLCGNKSLTKSLDRKFQQAIVEAKEIYEFLQTQKSERVMDYETNVPPPSFVKLTKNKYIPPLKTPGKIDDEEMECSCKPDDEDPCGTGTNCLTRLTFYECNPASCPAKERCQNQKFAKKEYFDLDCRRIAGKGWGLVAKTDIPSGSFIIEYIGEVINNAEMQRRTKEKEEQKDEHYYFLMLDGDTTIDAGPKGNLARFMNHSCDPNCETQKWNVRGSRCIGLFAIADIKAGTELTFNYNLESIGDSKKICHCNTSKCSGFIGGKNEKKNKKLKLKLDTPNSGKTKVKTEKVLPDDEEWLPE